MRRGTYIYILLISFFSFQLMLSSCENMQRDIELELPDYENKLVVESYLDRGQPFRVTLTESQGYFDSPGNPLIQEALVVISYKDINDTLTFNPGFTNIQNLKFYNFTSDNTVPLDYDGPYTIYVKDKEGREAIAETSFMTELPIDSVRVQFNDDDKALLLVTFQDPPIIRNFYRLIINPDSLSASPDVNFQISDASLNGELITLGTNYSYKEGDTVFVTLFHISEPYFRFLVTSSAARSSQGNPFGQPGSVESNIQGGLGIFTALTYDRRIIIIGE